MSASSSIYYFCYYLLLHKPVSVAELALNLHVVPDFCPVTYLFVALESQRYTTCFDLNSTPHTCIRTSHLILALTSLCTKEILL